MMRFFMPRLGAKPWAVLIIVGLAGCGDDAPPATIDQLNAEMAQRVAAVSRAEATEGLVPRFNQPKTVACAIGEFAVNEDIPDNLKQGVFANGGTFPVVMRFANASEQDDSKKDIRGLSLRLSEVPGEMLWGESGYQDFLLNSYPSLFVATPEEFLDFARARHEGSKIRFFLNLGNPHLKALWTVFKARKKHKSPLDIRYFSTVPFKHGVDSNQIVKYGVTPCSSYQTESVVEPGEHQLRAAIKAHLAEAPACFTFGVQLQTDPEYMPIEDASVIWKEKRSPFQPLATITINEQPIDDDSLAACEVRSFNPWQSLAAHEPVGRMNAVRREVYAAGAKAREQGVDQ